MPGLRSLLGDGYAWCQVTSRGGVGMPGPRSLWCGYVQGSGYVWVGMSGVGMSGLSMSGVGMSQGGMWVSIYTHPLTWDIHPLVLTPSGDQHNTSGWYAS